MNTAVVVVIVVVVVVLLMVLLSPKDKSEGVAVSRKKGPLGRIADVVGKAIGKKKIITCPQGYVASTDGKYCVPTPVLSITSQEVIDRMNRLRAQQELQFSQQIVKSNKI